MGGGRSRRGRVENFGAAPDRPTRWRCAARRIHDDVCARGFNAARGAFTQSYGSDDARRERAACSRIVGFLPPDDPRMRGTVAAIEHELVPRRARDALPTAAGGRRPAGGEGAFLAAASGSPTTTCSPADWTMPRRCSSGCSALRNDVGLLAEEYDPISRAPAGKLPAGVFASGARQHRRQLERRNVRRAARRPRATPCAPSP